MATSREDIRGWLEAGILMKATHCIVVVDTYDHDDYPVYVKPGENVKAKYDEYIQGKHSMQRVMEVYSLRKDIEPQLAQHRTFNFD